MTSNLESAAETPERDGIFSMLGFLVFLLFARAVYLLSFLLFQPSLADERALRELPSLLVRKGLFNICCSVFLISLLYFLVSAIPGWRRELGLSLRNSGFRFRLFAVFTLLLLIVKVVPIGRYFSVSRSLGVSGIDYARVDPELFKTFVSLEFIAFMGLVNGAGWLLYGLFNELFFRGLGMAVFSKSRSGAYAVVATSILYGVFTASLGGIVAGAVLAEVRRRGGSLYHCLAICFLADFVLTAINFGYVFLNYGK